MSFRFHEASGKLALAVSTKREIYQMPEEGVPPYMKAVEPTGKFPGRSAFWYSIAFVSVQMLGLAASLWVATTPWLLDHSPFLREIGYGHRSAGIGCEVVLYGDSSGEASLDPAVIQARTGLKSCNVSEIRPVLDFLGTSFPLDDYLAHNPAPKYIVTAWNPSDLNLMHRRLLGVPPNPEGHAYALLYDRGPWLWKGMLANPARSLSFLSWAESSSITDLLDEWTRADKKIPDWRARRDSKLGYWSFGNAPQKECDDKVSLPAPAPWQENANGIAAFRSHYESLGVHVIIDVAPVASCIPDVHKYEEALERLPDNSFTTLPIGNFNNENVHLTPEAAAAFSEMVAAQILARMHSAGPSEAAR